MSSTHDEEPVIHRPKPRRPFVSTTGSPSTPGTPESSIFPGKLDLSKQGAVSGTTTPARTHSILNLTTSTLFGIYQPNDDESTPCSSAAQTPAADRQGTFDFTKSARFPDSPQVVNRNAYKRATPATASIKPRPRQRPLGARVLAQLGREVVLLATGVLYGLLVSHLHDKQHIAPVQVDIDRSSWTYTAFWAVAGVLIGEALPLVDGFWSSRSHDYATTTTTSSASSSDTARPDDAAKRQGQGKSSYRGWNEVVRSVGVFVGISFAIRKLPWQSTLQLSLTLALANPALWYLIDRSVAGFVLSSVVSILGTSVLLLLWPQLIPPPGIAAAAAAASPAGATFNGTLAGVPAGQLVLGMFSSESVGVWTWIASVLFVSSVCFGNIGRQLTPREV